MTKEHQPSEVGLQSTPSRRGRGAEFRVKSTAASPSRGIALLVLGLSVFSVQDVVMKLLSDEVALQQIIFLRGVLTLFIVAALLLVHEGKRGFVVERPFLCLLRGFAGFACFTLFSMALATLPLADAMPLYYTSPLFVIALSMPFLAERVRVESWLAIFAGFAGTLLVARPSVSGVEPAMVLALGSAFAYSWQSLLARKLGSVVSALGMTLYSTIAFVALSGAGGLLLGSGWLDRFDHPSAEYLLRTWEQPTGTQLVMIASLGFIATIGFLSISQAYRVAEASTIAPFEYSSLPFAVLWGWLLWGHLPSLATVAGSLLIVAGGLFVLGRQSVIRAR